MTSKTNKQKLLNCVLSLILLCGFVNITNAQTITINGPSTGTTGNAPMGVSNFHVSEHIYLQTEINTAVSIDFLRFNMTTLGIPTFTNVAIYMKTSSASAFAASTTYGATPTSGFTNVYNGTMAWTAVGFAGVTLTTPFNYTNTAGQNLHVMIIRTDNTVHTGSVFAAALGNATSSTLLTSRRLNSITAPISTTVMTGSSFRAQIQFGHTLANDISVDNIYTLGKMPIEYGAPTVIQARVVNNGVNALTNVPVTCNITGGNTYTNVQTIASIAPGAAVTVSFANYSPTATSIADAVTVSVPNDDFNSNNSKVWQMDVTPNVYTYRNASLPNNGGVGFNGATGDFVAKFNSNIGVNFPYNVTNPQINEIKVDFATGGQPYQVGIWDATGAGATPGALLWQSVSATSVTGTAIIPVPDIPVAGDYFVGVRQTGTVNVSFAYQSESPIRSGTFYFTSPTGSATWTDFAPASPFRFSVEVSVHIPLPPNCAINLFPANGTTEACANPILSWGNGGGGPTGYDVYFGTNSIDVLNLNPSVLISANQPGTTFAPTMSPSTTYYWIIVPKNVDGDADACTMNSFTTGILPNCYCIPTHSPACAGIISDVSLNTITNPTSCTGGGYTVYPFASPTTTSLEQSSTYSLSVNSDASCIISVWIDYNQNGIFETTEWTQVTTASVANTASVVPLVIPVTALLGNTLMRIRTRFVGSPNGDIDACTSFGSGETEDYVVTITPQTPCAGTPTPGLTVSTSTLACPNSTVNLSLQNATAGTGVTYLWQSADDAAFTSNVTNLGTINNETATITSSKYFRCSVTCTGNTGVSTPILVNLNTDACQCATYCATTTPNTCDEFFSNVTFAGINNTSGCNYPYIFYANVSGAVTAGSTYPLTYGTTTFYIGDTVNVFFDWNQNGVFTDPGETYATSSTAAGTASIAVPSTALAGTTRMRIRMAWVQQANACGANDFSETEDYCITVSPLPTNSVLNLTCLIEGYVDAAQSPTVAMRPVLMNQGVAGATIAECDTITVSLHDVGPLFTEVGTTNVVLNTSGVATCTFPPLTGSYYVRLTHRNSIQTWSASTVAISSSPASYNFTSGAAQAAGSNMVDVTLTGVYAIYSGDFNQDGGVENGDYVAWETDANDFASGYYNTDFNGDGGVENGDFVIWDNNASNFVGTVTP